VFIANVQLKRFLWCERQAGERKSVAIELLESLDFVHGAAKSSLWWLARLRLLPEIAA
jgi:hypothetical protein